MKLSTNIDKVAPPPIPMGRKWANLFHETPERPLINMTQGVPGNAPPDFFLEAIAKESADPKNAGYGPILGETNLREVVASEMKLLYGEGIDVQSDDIGITAGCNMAFAALVPVLTEPGDEVILTVPWYFNQQMNLEIERVTVIELRLLAEENFIPSVQRCEALITPKTKAIVLVTPSNPTGAIYPPELLRDFAYLARRYGIALIIDETYRDFVTNRKPHFLFTPSDDWNWRDTVISLFSFSKSYAIPGHRLGGLIASPQVLQRVAVVLDCFQICPPRPVQAALANCIPKFRQFIRDTSKALDNRHKLFRSALADNWTIGSSGGYYAFFKHPFKNIPSVRVCEELARQVGVVFLPGVFFGPTSTDQTQVQSDDGWIRGAVANISDDKVVSVGERLREFERISGWEMEH